MHQMLQIINKLFDAHILPCGAEWDGSAAAACTSPTGDSALAGGSPRSGRLPRPPSQSPAPCMK